MSPVEFGETVGYCLTLNSCASAAALFVAYRQSNKKVPLLIPPAHHGELINYIWHVITGPERQREDPNHIYSPQDRQPAFNRLENM